MHRALAFSSLFWRGKGDLLDCLIDLIAFSEWERMKRGSYFDEILMNVLLARYHAAIPRELASYI